MPSACRRTAAAAETAAMSSCSSCNSSAPAVVVRGVDVGVLAKLLQQQRRDGDATVQLLEAAAPAASPRQGAAEPGKGALVDVTA